jgi:hypothetical protein
MQQEHMNQGPGLGIRRLCVSSRSPTRGRVGPAEGAGPNPGSCRTPSLFPFSAHLRVSAMLSVTWHAVSSHLACLVQAHQGAASLLETPWQELGWHGADVVTGCFFFEECWQVAGQGEEGQYPQRKDIRSPGQRQSVRQNWRCGGGELGGDVLWR